MIKPRDLKHLAGQVQAAQNTAIDTFEDLAVYIQQAKTEAGRKQLKKIADTLRQVEAAMQSAYKAATVLNDEALQQYNDPEQNPEALKKLLERERWFNRRYINLLKDNGIKYHSQ